MWVVTAAAGGERSGCLVGFATQVSIRPARFLACLSVMNHTHGVALAATALAVHPLAGAEAALAELFGGETGDEVDKFARCTWEEGPEGVPVLDTRIGWFVGRVVERLDLGDHTGHVLEPVAVRVGDVGAGELGYRRARAIEPGHEP